jgi:hypothetical protein
MRDLPNDWYEKSMRPLREEAKQWPDWMRKGVDEAKDQAALRMAKYLPDAAPLGDENPR